jgi:hypothetical protein
MSRLLQCGHLRTAAADNPSNRASASPHRSSKPAWRALRPPEGSTTPAILVIPANFVYAVEDNGGRDAARKGGSLWPIG